MEPMSPIETVRSEVKRRGLRPVAAELGKDRKTVALWLAGCCREGSALLLERRAAEVFGPGAPDGTVLSCGIDPIEHVREGQR